MTGSIMRRATLVAARGTLLAAALLVAAGVLLTTLRSPPAQASRADDDAPRIAEAARPGLVELDLDGQEKGGIATAPPTPAPYQDLVRAYGTVLALDKLTVLFNQSLINVAQLGGAQAKSAASEVASERARNNLKVFTTAKAQVEAATGTSEVDAAGVEAARAQVEALRNTAIQDWGPVLGDAIADRTALARDLVRRKTTLVQLSLPSGAALTPPPRLAVSRGGAAPVEGRLISEATQTDPRVQGISYFYAVPASPGLLPGASVVASLPRAGIEPGLDIPSSAVVWQAGKPWMYLRTAPDAFQRHAIDEAAAPTRDGGYIVPARSLPEARPIVTAGAQVLLSQEMRAQIPEDDN